MAAGIDVLGPYAPADFREINLSPGTRATGSLSKAMTDDVTAAGGTVVSVEPITVLGNVYLVVYTSS